MSFRRHVEADKRLSSAKLLAETIAGLPAYEAHKRELLSVCLWKVTEAEGPSKYAIRYRSRGALGAAPEVLRHEHVLQRRRLVDRMLAEPIRAGEIALEAIGCVVTKEEHDRLTAVSRARPDLDGWARYRAAGVQIVDTTTGEEITLP